MKQDWSYFCVFPSHFGKVPVTLFLTSSHFRPRQRYSVNIPFSWIYFCRASVTVPSMSTKCFVDFYPASGWGPLFVNMRNRDPLPLFWWPKILSTICCSSLMVGTGACCLGTAGAVSPSCSTYKMFCKTWITGWLFEWLGRSSLTTINLIAVKRRNYFAQSLPEPWDFE